MASFSSTQDTITRLQSLDPYEFEHFVAELWEQQGWQTEVRQQSNDHGIDVVAVRDDPVRQKQVLQVKRYASDNKVGGPEIQQYASLRHHEGGVDTVVVVTTSDFTSDARDRAQELNVKLVNGESLQSLINQYGDGGLLDGGSDETGSDSKAPPNLMEGGEPGSEADGSWIVTVTAVLTLIVDLLPQILTLLVVGYVVVESAKVLL
jgi:hypothetical protein